MSKSQFCLSFLILILGFWFLYLINLGFTPTYFCIPDPNPMKTSEGCMRQLCVCDVTKIAFLTEDFEVYPHNNISVLQP